MQRDASAADAGRVLAHDVDALPMQAAREAAALRFTTE
jgi:hypothetical protein